MNKIEIKPLDPLIIEEIRKREERRKKSPVIQPEIDDDSPADNNIPPKPEPDPPDRGVKIITPGEKKDDSDTGYHW